MDILHENKITQSIVSSKVQEFSRVIKHFCNFIRLITIKVGTYLEFLLYSPTYVTILVSTYPRALDITRAILLDAYAAKTFSLYLRLSDPFRTRVAKVVEECIAASVSPSEIPVMCTSIYDYTS